MSFARILVPTDLTHFSDGALRCAEAFAKRFGSRITLLHAGKFGASMYRDHPLGFYFENAPPPKRALQERLCNVAREHFAGDVETVVVDDEPAHAIATTAADINADLIIMATHGSSGSVTKTVRRMTSRPLLAVHETV